MVKAYLRYEQAAAFGVIASNSNMVFTKDGSTLATASLEAVSLWSVRQAALVSPLLFKIAYAAHAVLKAKPGLHARCSWLIFSDMTLTAHATLSRLRSPVQQADILADTSEAGSVGY